MVGVDISKEKDFSSIAVIKGGITYLATLPKGYDERLRIMVSGGRILVAHPDFALCEIKNSKLVPICLT